MGLVILGALALYLLIAIAVVVGAVKHAQLDFTPLTEGKIGNREELYKRTQNDRIVTINGDADTQRRFRCRTARRRAGAYRKYLFLLNKLSCLRKRPSSHNGALITSALHRKRLTGGDGRHADVQRNAPRVQSWA